MNKKLKGFDRLRKVIALGTVGSAGLLGAGTGRAGSTATGVCQRHTIRVSNVVTQGTIIDYDLINATVYASSVLASTTPVSHNSISCSSFKALSDVKGSLTFVAAFGLSEASIDNISHSWSGTNYTGSSSTGSSSSDSLTDAFDGYGGIFVDGAPYNDTDGQVDITGTTLTTDADTMPNGLNVSSQYHMFTDKRVIRIIHTIENPTGATINSRVAIGGNLGSDSTTYVQNTSNSNQTVEIGDTWVITHDASVFGGEATEDPILTHVVGSSSGTVAIPLRIPGTPIQPPSKSNNKSINGRPGINLDSISFGYDLIVPAGETQQVVWFTHLGQNIGGANAALPDFSDSAAAIAAGLYSNLPAGMSNTGVNWGSAPIAVGPAPIPAVIPVFSPISLLVLSGMFGFAASRRLRKVK